MLGGVYGGVNEPVLLHTSGVDDRVNWLLNSSSLHILKTFARFRAGMLVVLLPFQDVEFVIID